MKKLILILFLLPICFYLNAQSFSKGKSLPFHFYPDEYKLLNADNWDVLQGILDSCLTYENTLDLRKSQMNIKGWFVLSRIADIEWAKTQKEYIASYLSLFIKKVVLGNSFIKDLSKVDIGNKTFFDVDAVFLPHKAIWVALILNETIGCKIIEDSWKSITMSWDEKYANSLKSAILWSISTKYQSEQIYTCFTVIKNSVNPTFSVEDNRIINVYLLKRQLFQFKDENKAWEYLWTISGKNISDVYTREVQFLWRQNILLIREIYVDPKISVLLDIVQKESDFNKKYLFLYCATFLTNSKKSDASSLNKIEVERLKKLVEDLYKKENLKEKKQMLKQNNYDFLKSAFSLIS